MNLHGVWQYASPIMCLVYSWKAPKRSLNQKLQIPTSHKNVHQNVSVQSNIKPNTHWVVGNIVERFQSFKFRGRTPQIRGGKEKKILDQGITFFFGWMDQGITKEESVMLIFKLRIQVKNELIYRLLRNQKDNIHSRQVVTHP